VHLFLQEKVRVVKPPDYTYCENALSLPALMQLMGHSDIETTMHYVQVSPQDVYLQYARAAAQCIHPQPEIPS
jgi:integrase